MSCKLPKSIQKPLITRRSKSKVEDWRDYRIEHLLDYSNDLVNGGGFDRASHWMDIGFYAVFYRKLLFYERLNNMPYLDIMTYIGVMYYYKIRDFVILRNTWMYRNVRVIETFVISMHWTIECMYRSSFLENQCIPKQSWVVIKGGDVCLPSHIYYRLPVRDIKNENRHETDVLIRCSFLFSTVIPTLSGFMVLATSAMTRRAISNTHTALIFPVRKRCMLIGCRASRGQKPFNFP